MKADFIDTKFGEGNASSIPALGMAWSYCVNTRISLHRNSSAVRAISMIHDRGDINGDGDGSGGEDEGAAAGVGAAARDAKDGYPTVKVEQEASVGSKRSYGHVSATGVSHPYSRPFDDSFYADLSGYCDDAPSSGSRISKSNAVCTAIMVHSSADKENSSANSVPAAEKAGVKPELSASYAGLPRAIQYYRHGGSGGGGSASGAGVSGGVSGARSTRSMRLEFSPCKGSAECAYEITSTGIMGIF